MLHYSVRSMRSYTCLITQFKEHEFKFCIMFSKLHIASFNCFSSFSILLKLIYPSCFLLSFVNYTQLNATIHHLNSFITYVLQIYVTYIELLTWSSMFFFLTKSLRTENKKY